MSYTEYLRRKADTSQKIIDYQPKKVDASQFITQQRLKASALFRLNGREGVINNMSDPSNTGTTSNPKAPQGVVKAAGGYVPDASTFTAYSGGNAIDQEQNQTARNTKYVVPANLPSSLCTNTFLNGRTAPKSAGDWVRSQAPCVNDREPHNANEVSAPLFVDNTIRLKHLVGCTVNEISDANHTHPVEGPHNTEWIPRPAKAKIPVFTVPSPSDARKVGNYDYKDHQKYVEKHHATNLTTSFARVPRKYVIPGQPPAQLKINDPRHYPVS